LSFYSDDELYLEEGAYAETEEELLQQIKGKGYEEITISQFRDEVYELVKAVTNQIYLKRRDY
jgi:hypothetical protein